MTRRISTTAMSIGLVGVVLVVSACSSGQGSIGGNPSEVPEGLVDGTDDFVACMDRAGFGPVGQVQVVYSKTGDFFAIDQLVPGLPEREQAFLSLADSEATDRRDKYSACAEELLSQGTEPGPLLEPLPARFRAQVESCLLQAPLVSGLVLIDAGVDEAGHLDIKFEHDGLEDPLETVLTDSDRACLERVERAYRDHRTAQGS